MALDGAMTPSDTEALLQVAKRARKYRLGLMTFTQDVDDFLGEHWEGGAVTGHAGRSIRQNNGTKLALIQDSAAPFLASARRGRDCRLPSEARSCWRWWQPIRNTG